MILGQHHLIALEHVRHVREHVIDDKAEAVHCQCLAEHCLVLGRFHVLIRLSTVVPVFLHLGRHLSNVLSELEQLLLETHRCLDRGRCSYRLFCFFFHFFSHLFLLLLGRFASLFLDFHFNGLIFINNYNVLFVHLLSPLLSLWFHSSKLEKSFVCKVNVPLLIQLVNSNCAFIINYCMFWTGGLPITPSVCLYLVYCTKVLEW